MGGTEETKYTAYHEASHAVAAVRHGSQDVGATIVRHGAFGGSASSDAWHFMQDHGRREVLIGLFAGYAGAVAAGQDPAAARQAAGHDFEEAREIMQALGETDEAAWVARAQAFVAGNWQAIERVAAELLEAQTVDGQLLDVLVGVADGEITEAELARFRLLAGGSNR